MNQMNVKGRKQTPEHIAARTAARKANGWVGWNKGMPWSAEIRLKLSEANKGVRNARYNPDRELVSARFAARRFMKDVIRRTLINKKSSCAELLGYDRDDLVQHLESQFTAEMRWSNYGSFWEIDHIKPVALFVIEGVMSPEVVSALSNLRPLKKEENRSKGTKYV